jgi:uncharacterized protein DUF5658
VAGIRVDWIAAVDGRSARFGNVVVIAFLIAQACDGVFTYVGVSSYGLRVEGNPLLGWLMAGLGSGAGVAAAKATTGAFGIVLHLVSVHRVVAALAVFYIAVAVVPWIGILFF